MSSSIKVIKPQHIIDLKDIVVQFPSRDGSLFSRNKVTAVGGVNFHVNAGETVGIVGESGCGKSTLANVMIGLQQPSGGEVKFNGLKMQYGSAKARKQFGRQVSVIFQDPATALNPRMKVFDILRDPLDIHDVLQPHEREKRVYELLSRVGLPRSAAAVEPTRLSGGQKQLVDTSVAFAIHDVISEIRPTNIMFMDEPFESLGLNEIEIVSELVQEKAKNKSLFLITHHPSFNPMNTNDIIVSLDENGNTNIS